MQTELEFSCFFCGDEFLDDNIMSPYPWLGMICNGNSVLTIGVFYSEENGILWGQQSIALMEEHKQEDIEMPDDYEKDRMQ